MRHNVVGRDHVAELLDPWIGPSFASATLFAGHFGPLAYVTMWILGVVCKSVLCALCFCFDISTRHGVRSRWLWHCFVLVGSCDVRVVRVGEVVCWSGVAGVGIVIVDISHAECGVWCTNVRDFTM